MNEFSSTQNSSGLLQNDYGDSPLQAALKKKREKLKETKLGAESDPKLDKGEDSDGG